MDPERHKSPDSKPDASKERAASDPNPEAEDSMLDDSLFDSPDVTDGTESARMSIVINFGKYNGQEVDRRFRRSIEILDEDRTSFLVDHFFHDGKFYRARIPKTGVEHIIGQRFNFDQRATNNSSGWLPAFRNPALNHAQTRFLLSRDSPIELYSETSERPVEQIYDFVYTLEAVGPRGVSWSHQDAYGNLAAAHRIVSTKEVFFERVLLNKYLVIQTPPLLIPQEKKDEALQLVIQNSDAAGPLQPYYLWKGGFDANNCTSEPFRLLDTLMKDEYGMLQRLAARIFRRLPVALRSYLDFRGVLDKSKTMPPLNEEYAHLNYDEGLKERAAARSR